MQFQYTPYIIPLIALALFSSWVMVYSWQRRGALNAAILSVLAAAIAEWLIGYALEIAGADYATKLFWGKSQYIGIVLAPLAWVVFTYYHTQQGKQINVRNLAFLAIIPAITILMAFTTEKHGLVWANIVVEQAGSFSALGVSHGIWFWVHSAYSYSLLLAGAVIIIRSLGRNMGLYRRQAVALIIAVLAPWIGNALYLSGYSPIPHLDLTPFAFTITLASLAWAIFGSQLVNISPIARDLIVDGMQEGMIVIDQRNFIVDINPAAARIIGVSHSQAIGKKFAEVFTPWQSLIERFRNAVDVTSEITVGEGEVQRRYEVRISSLIDQQRIQLGRLITLRSLDGGEMPEPRFAVRDWEIKPQSELEAEPAAIKRAGLIGWFVDFISTPTKSDLQAPPDTNPKWHQARERSFTMIMRVAALLGTVVLALVGTFSRSDVGLPFAIIIALFWVLGLVRNVNFNTRAILFLALVYAMAFIEMYSFGYSADSLTFFMTLVVTSTLLLGRNIGLSTFAITMITIGIFGISIGSGNFLPIHAHEGIPVPGTVQRALTTMLAFASCAAALIVAVTIFMESLNKAWQLETQALNLLQQERDLLEQRVTERTADLRKYFRAIEQSGNSIVITNTKGNIEYVNPKFEQVTGYSFEEVKGRNPRILKSGKQDLEFYKDLWGTITSGQVWHGTFNNRRKDGSLYWESATIAPVVDQNGQATHYVAIKEDITAHRQAEEELLKLSRAVEQSGNTVIIMDRNGVIEYVNPKFSKVSGYSPEEALGKIPAELMQGVDAPDLRTEEWWLTVNAGHLWHGEFKNHRKDGTAFWESATIAPVQDASGTIINFVEIKQDVTEEKLLQEQLQKQNDYLSILHQITLDLLNRRDLNDLLQVIVDRSAVLLDAPFSEIMLERDNVLVVKAFTVNQPHLKGDRVTREQAKLSWQAFDTHQPVILEDYSTWEHRRELYDAQQVHATAEFPVMAGERCLGILSLGRPQPNYAFDSEQIKTGILFARLVALVLDNANLYDSARKEIAERVRAETQIQSFLNDIKALQEVNLELSEVEELDTLYVKMIDMSQHRMGMDRAGLFIIDPITGDLCGTYGIAENGQVRDERYYRETVGEGHWTFEIANANNHTILWENAPIYDDGRIVGYGWKVATALWNGHRSIGYIVSDNFLSKRPPRSYEVELISLLGSAFGHLIERIRDQISLQRSNQQQQVINSLLKVSLENRSLNDVLYAILDEMFSIDWLSIEPKGGIFLLNEQTSMLELHAHRDLASDLQIQCAKIAMGQCLCGLAALRREIQFANCIDEYHTIGYEGMPEHGHYNVPLLQGDKVLGVLVLYLPHQYKKTEDDLLFLSAAADVITGILQRKQAETLLLDSEARFRQIVENASDIIYRTDANGYFTYINPIGLHTMGFTDESQMIGKHYLELVLPSMRHSLKRKLDHQWLSRTKNSYHEVIAITADGREIWLGQNVQLILNDNEATGFQALARDITELKQAQEAIALSRDQALEASQLKTQLLSRVSHELRTPLGGILGYAELLRSNAYGPMNTEQKTVITRISESSNYLTTIINDLLDEAQISSKNINLHIAAFRPTELLDSMRARTTVLAHNKSLYLNTELDSNLPETLYGDEKRLQQIIINLVGNAVKFTKSGGVKIRLFVPGPARWGIEVSDTGFGIPEEDQRYIFDAFRQVNNAITNENRGTGLGLSIVKQLVEIMDGSIHLTSKVGEGSTFTIILPLITPEESHS
jgi:PAS domain S-box-containing protein